MACRRAVSCRASLPMAGRVLKIGERKAPPNTLTLMSHNILCDLFCTPSRFPQIQADFLEADRRFKNFEHSIIDFDADVVCLQEAAIVEWDRLNGFMQDQGYSGVHQSTKAHKVPLACFFKRESILLQWSEERSRTLLCEFRTGSEKDKPLYVINVHLEGKPEKSGSRVSQIHKALKRLHHHVMTTGDVRDPKEAKVIVAGDFNSQMEDGPCMFLDQGQIDATLDASHHDHYDEHGHKVSTLTHPFSPFREVYVASHFEPPFTHVRNRSGSRVDFMWATSTIEVAGVIDPVPVNATAEGILSKGIPDERFCSDHLPIGCQIYV